MLVVLLVGVFFDIRFVLDDCIYPGRLNRDIMPLHKPGAFFRNEWIPMTCSVNAIFTLLTLLAFQDDIHVEWKKCWSVTYVATPIAVAVRETLFTSYCLFNSAVCCVQRRNFCAYLLIDP